MLKIFFSANAFSLLAFFRDVPFGRTKSLACQLKLNTDQATTRYASLSSSEDSHPVTDLPYLKILHKWLISAAIFTREFKVYDIEDELAIKALNSLVHVLFSNSLEIHNNKTLFLFQ